MAHAKTTSPPVDPGGIFDADRAGLSAAGGNFVINSEEMRADYNGETTFKVGFDTGSAWFKGAVEAGVLILPGAPPE